MRDMDFERGHLRGRHRLHLTGQSLSEALCWVDDESPPPSNLIGVPGDGGDYVFTESWRPSKAPGGGPVTARLACGPVVVLVRANLRGSMVGAWRRI